MLNEIWKPVEEFPNYSISSYGRLKNSSGKIIKTHKTVTSKGYLYYGLWRKNKMYNRSAHRLTAIAFISNPNNKKYVNHIDCNRANNHIDNLEWVTASENIQHAMTKGSMTFSSLKGLKSKNASSKYHNVCYFKKRENQWRYICTLKVNGKRLSNKTFKNEIECAKHYDDLLKQHNITDRPLNFP